jgi:ABC-2 type transport system ATP-binding protein
VVAAGVPALRSRGLTRFFGGQAACRDVTLDVPRGCIFGLLGCNGAGKSTFVRMVVGLCRPSSGEAAVLGIPAREPEARRLLGFLPEHFRYPEWATGAEVLDFHAVLLHVAPLRRRARIAALLDRVGLAAAGRRRVGGYSKGMQQRLGLAVAMLGDPQLLLLDEPTSALDPLGRREVRELLLGLRAEGRTVFLNSHLLSEVEQVADRVAIIRGGEVVADGAPDDLADGGPEAEVEVRRDDAAALAALDAGGRILGREEQPGGLVRVRVALRTREAAPDLAAAVVGAGGRLHGLQVRSRSLEDIFVDLAGAGER